MAAACWALRSREACIEGAISAVDSLPSRGGDVRTRPEGVLCMSGASPGATAGDIRAAFHRCAKQCHPDIHSGPYAKVRFQAINEAYRTLSNPGQRATYDGSLPVARPERFETRLYQFREWRTELDSLALTPTSQPQLAQSVQVHPVTAAAPPPSSGPPRQFHRIHPVRAAVSQRTGRDRRVQAA